MKIILFTVSIIMLVATGRAQQMDNPVSLPVNYFGEGIVSAGGQPWSQFSFGSSLGATSTASGSYLVGGSTVFSPLTTTNIIPGKDYTVQVSSYNFSVVYVKFAAVPGYEIYLGPTAATWRSNTITLGSNYTFHFRLEAINDITNSLAGKRGGEASSLAEDKPIWYVGLGSLRSGRFAGAVGFRRGAFTSDLYRTSALIYDSVDTSEVSVVRNSSTGYIESITSREVKIEVDTYDPNGTQYEIRVKRIEPNGTPGSTFITYTVIQYGSNAGVLIIKNEGGAYEATRLENSGSTWTLYDWRKSDSTGTFTDDTKRVISIVSSNTTEVYYGDINAISAPVLRKQKNYTTYYWGKELTSVKWGPLDAQPPTTTYSYYTSSSGTGWPRSIESMVEPTGNWTKYDYYNAANDTKGGLVYRIYRPWLDYPTSPSAATPTNSLVETYNYATNFDGTTTAPSSKITTVNGTTAAKTTWSYNWSYGAANSRSRYSKTQYDYATSSSSLATTTIAFRPDDSVSFFQNAPHCITRPDGTRDSYAYYYGTWNATTRVFTQSDSGADRLTLVLHGQTTGGAGTTQKTSWTVGSKVWTIESTYLVDNLSTISETVTDCTGHTVFTAENIFTGASAMERIAGAERTVNSNNLISKELDIMRTVGTKEVAVKYEYSGGRMTSQTDIDGTKTTYAYDNHFRVESKTTAAGGSGDYPAKTQTFTYNLADQKETATDCSCSSSPTTFVYESTGTGRLDYMTEPKPAASGGSLTTHYTYNSPRQTTVELPTGATLVTSLYYDGRLKSELGTGQDETYYDYAVGSYSITATVRNGSGTAYPWRQTITDGLGRVSQERAPQVGWSTSATSKVARKTYTYSATTGQLTKVATTDEAASYARLLPDHLYSYGKLGLLVMEGDDLGSNGYLETASTDRITSYSTEFYKDAQGFNGWIRKDLTLVHWTNGTNNVTTTVSDRRTRYTSFNNGAADGDSLAIQDVVELDANNRALILWKWVNPLARSRKQAIYQHYNAAAYAGTATTLWQDGYLKSETSPTGVTHTRTYNAQGLLASVTEGDTNAQTSLTYYEGTSAVFETTKSIGAATSATTTTSYYWASDTVTPPALPETSAFKVKTTDAAAKVSYTEFDLKGRVWRVWGNAAQPALYGYDSYGRNNALTTWRSGSFNASTWPSTPGTGDVTTWTVDPASGAATAKTYPNTSSVGFTYNSRGQLATRTWARGVTTTYAYDALTGELSGKTYSDSTPSVSYTYNRFGALNTVTDAAGTRTFNYNSDLKLNSESLGAFYGSRALTTTYDASVPGRSTGYSFNGNIPVALARGFDSLGRVNSVTGTSDSANTTFAIGYQAGTDWASSAESGNYKREMPLAAKHDVIASATTTWNGAERARFVAGYDDARGYRNKIENGNSSGTPAESWSKKLGLGDGYKATLVYDDYGRLDNNTSTALAWQNAAGTQSLSARSVDLNYDLAGNRSGSNTDWGGASSYTASNLNLYTSITGAKAESPLTYDADGNLTQDGTWTYAYNAENRLQSMNNGVIFMAFGYDYMDRRIRKSVLIGAVGNETRYVWSGWRLVAETSSNGYTVLRSFIWGPDFSDAQGAAGGAGSLLAQYTGSTLAYAVPDVQGNIVGYLNGSGNFVAAREFSPTGEQINSYGASVGYYPIGYAGQYTDSESGLVYYGKRYYKPKHGRFINRDPIGEAGGNNLYAFVGNAPTRGWDVLGMLTCWTNYELHHLTGYHEEVRGSGHDTRYFYFPTSQDYFHETTECTPDEQPPPPSLQSGTFTQPALQNDPYRNSSYFDPRELTTYSGSPGGSSARRGDDIMSTEGHIDGNVLTVTTVRVSWFGDPDGRKQDRIDSTKETGEKISYVGKGFPMGIPFTKVATALTVGKVAVSATGTVVEKTAELEQNFMNFGKRAYPLYTAEWSAEIFQLNKAGDWVKKFDTGGWIETKGPFGSMFMSPDAAFRGAVSDSGRTLQDYEQGLITLYVLENY